MLELENITAGYGRTTVIHDVSLSTGNEGVVAVLGQGGLGRDRPSPAVGDRLSDDVDHAADRAAAGRHECRA